jgi:DNA-binding GntR family transcriptional regulator
MLTAADQDNIRKPSQTDNAYVCLKRMIISGEIDPSEQIDANKLVDVLGCGRTPVREALLRLQIEGIVRVVPKRGVQIVMLSADDITEIYQVISAVEIEAVRLLTMAAPAITQLDKLTVASDRMIKAAQGDKRDQWIQADEDFHRTLLELNPNRRLRDVGLLHRDLAQRAHFVALRLLRSEHLLKSARQHKKLIKLITTGDTAAVASHQLQRDRGAKMLVDVLRQYRLKQL